jgi:chromosome segregation ATPase
MTRSSFLPQSRTINMSQSPIALSYTLEDVLARLEGKIDNLSKDAGDLKVGQTELAGQVKALDERLSGQVKALDERLSGQVKALDERLSGQIKALDERLSGQMQGMDERLSGQIKALDERLSGQVSQIDSRLKTVESSVQKIPDLAEKVGELKNWRQIAVITITAAISGTATWFIRGGTIKP